MPFTLELVLSGLIFLCVNPHECPGNGTFGYQPAVAYMVRTNNLALKICDQTLPSDVHHPYLAVKPEDIDLISVDYKLYPDPQGGQLAVIDLADQDFCLNTGAADQGIHTYHPDHGNYKEPQANVGADAYAWVASTKEVLQPDPRPKLRSELGEPSRGNSYIVATVRIESGTFKSKRLGRKHHSSADHPYLVWDLTTSTPGTYVPYKTLADEVVLEAKNLTSAVELTDCSLPPHILLKLEPSGNVLRAEITNLPTKTVDHSGNDLDHFRWFYRLLDVGNGTDLKGCPVPHDGSSHSHESTVVTGAGVFCPPLSGS